MSCSKQYSCRAIRLEKWPSHFCYFFIGNSFCGNNFVSILHETFKSHVSNMQCNFLDQLYKTLVSWTKTNPAADILKQGSVRGQVGVGSELIRDRFIVCPGPIQSRFVTVRGQFGVGSGSVRGRFEVGLKFIRSQFEISFKFVRQTPGARC